MPTGARSSPSRNGPPEPASADDRASHESRAALWRRGNLTQGLVMIMAAMGVIAGLYFGQALLIPLVLSFLLSFLLLPLVERLERWRLGNTASVLIAVAIAAAVATVVVGIVTYQVIQLADSLPQYQSNIRQKAETVREVVSKPLSRLRRVSEVIDADAPDEAPAPGEIPKTIAAPVEPDVPAQPAASSTAAKEPESLTPMQILSYLLGTTIGPLASGGIVLVLVIFILWERKELRARLIRLLGSQPGQLYVSTQALDDAASRVSRYLLMQLVVNVTYGIPIGIGLYFIGVPSAFLWGMLAVLLRFIPYIGPIVAASLPIALAVAVDPGWGRGVVTLMLFVVVEIISNNFVEPRLYGSSTGISPLGIIVSAVFWAWLWGPIGLLIATPMTACLVVLGRHIPAMSIFPLILGDQPALDLHARILQRLLALDLNEPDELTRRYLATHPLAEYYDQVLIPLLCMLEEARLHQSIGPDQTDFVLDRVREIIEDTAELPDPPTKPAANEGSANGLAAAMGEPKPAAGAEAPPPESIAEAEPARPDPHTHPGVLTLAADDAADELVAQMLAVLLQRRGVPAAASRGGFAPAAAAGENIIADPAVVCVVALPPVAIVRARHRVSRIRTRFHDAQIVLALWQTPHTPSELRERLGPAGDTPIASSLADALDITLGLLARAKTASATR